MADLVDWDVKLKEPNDRAEARPLEEEAPEVAGLSGTVGDERALVLIDETLCEAPWRGPFCLRSCNELASAFSCVRT